MFRTSNPRLAKEPPGGQGKPALLGRISQETLNRLEAETALFMTEYVPRVEREANRDRRKDAELVKDLALHHFNQIAAEILKVCHSLEEYEEALAGEIPCFLRTLLDRYPFLGGPVKEELDAGLSFYRLRVNPWAEIPEKDRGKVWHVGALTGEALSHTALRWRAEAWNRVAAGQLPAGNPDGRNGPEAAPPEDTAGAAAKSLRAEARRGFVEPLLAKKGFSVFDWAIQAMVDFHTANDYLHGQTKPYPSTRKKLAEALGVTVEDLPR